MSVHLCTVLSAFFLMPIHTCPLMYSHRKATAFAFKEKDKSIEIYMSGPRASVGNPYLSVCGNFHQPQKCACRWGAKRLACCLPCSWGAQHTGEKTPDPVSSSEASDSLAPYPAARKRVSDYRWVGKSYSVLSSCPRWLV